MEKYRCSTCLKIPHGLMVFHCKNGHPICEKCATKNNTLCSQCLVPFGETKIRCRVLEEVIAELELNCPFKETGCKVKTTKRDLRGHLQACPFRLVGYGDCQYASSRGSELFAHLQTVHEHTPVSLNPFSVVLNKLVDSLKRKDGFSGVMASEVVISPSPSSSVPSKFVIYFKAKASEGYVTIFCFYLGDNPNDVSRYQVDIEVNSRKTANVSHFKDLSVSWKWAMLPAHYKEAESVMQTPPYKIPVKYLMEDWWVGEKSPQMEFRVKFSQIGGSQ